jgi:peptidoglycan hydrolase-like protein with peptidoglycan-binding domain
MPWGRKGEGVYANGEDFASEQENPDERSVQIAFFAQGSEPRMEDHKGGSKASLKQNPTQDPAQVRKERIEHTKPKQLTIPVFDRHFNPGSALPSFGDNSLLEVLAALSLRLQKNPDLELSANPLDTTASPSLSQARIRTITAILHNDVEAWHEITSQATTRDIQCALTCANRLGWPCSPGTIDGTLGPKTTAGIQRFQWCCQSIGISGSQIDGVCGPKTWRNFLTIFRSIIGASPLPQNQAA